MTNSDSNNSNGDSANSIEDAIKKDLKDAIKASNNLVKDILRGAVDKIKKVKIDKQTALSTEEALEVISSQIKKAKESLEYYREKGRDDLIERAEKEIEVLESYLPEQLDEDELADIIEEKVEEIGVSSMEKFGELMGELKDEIGAKASNSKIAEIAKKVVQGK